MVLGIGTLRIRKRRSYSQQKDLSSMVGESGEKTLGFEGRYRRTISPSRLPSVSDHPPPINSSASSPPPMSQLDSALSPTAWEKYHNIRPQSTTVVFTSTELANPCSGSSMPAFNASTEQPTLFHRSISSDSNLFNNKTGFSQQPSLGTPPVAQVAPLRGGPSSPDPFQLNRSSSSIYSSQGSMPLLESWTEDSSSVGPNNASQKRFEGIKKLSSYESTLSPQAQQLAMVSPLGFPAATHTRPPFENKENLPRILATSPGCKDTEVGCGINWTSDASSQTDSGNEEEIIVVGELKRMSPPNTLRPHDPGNLSIITTLSSSSIYSSSSSTVSSSFSSSASETPQPNITDESGIGLSNLSISVNTLYGGRQKTQEELACEELSRDFAKHLPQGDKLQSLLVPLAAHKTSADYIEGIFHLDLKQVTRGMNGQVFQNQSPSPEHENNEAGTERVASMSPDSKNEIPFQNTLNGHAPLPADSAYFTTSECKAKFLTQYVNDMQPQVMGQQESQDLKKQKEELISRISRKLEILRIEQSEIVDEIGSNELLGQTVIERVKETAKANEFHKFKLHVEEIEKITSLLLGLSGRLARAENALMGLSEHPTNPAEKKTLETKRNRLKEQLEEAKILKENIDRRSAQVSGFLQTYLLPEEFADYHHFTKMKAKLIIDARDIDEKIKLGEEQMAALEETLGTFS